tara:strand:+ start:421 stop:909 length:489 start_codon:yes stop_codon:yes gene_type:complete
MHLKNLSLEVLNIAIRSLPFGRTTDEILRLIYRFNSSQKEMDQQVEEAMTALSRSTQIISELESSLETRSNKLKQLKDEYDRISKLSEITEQQGAAVAKTLESIMGKGRTRERWLSFLINIAAGSILFLIGVFASDWIKALPDQLPSLSPAKISSQNPIIPQ